METAIRQVHGTVTADRLADSSQQQVPSILFSVPSQALIQRQALIILFSDTNRGLKILPAITMSASVLRRVYLTMQGTRLLSEPTQGETTQPERKTPSSD